MRPRDKAISLEDSILQRGVNSICLTKFKLLWATEARPKPNQKKECLKTYECFHI